MEAIAEDVFTFDELSDDAKEHARESMRESEGQDFDTEFLYDSFDTASKILGIDFDVNEDIYWSGFSSQGDGASFKGSYHHAPNSPAKIRAEFPEETGLHAIADGLDAIQNGYKLLSGHRIDVPKISRSTNYCHEMTMQIEILTDSVTGEEFDYDDPREKIILELMRDFARWMYKSLEEEYDYRQSDEQIDDTIRANDYKFDEDGDRID